MRIGETSGTEQTRQRIADGRPAGKADFSMALRKAEEQAGGAAVPSAPGGAEAAEFVPPPAGDERKHTDFRRRFWEIVKGGAAKQDPPAPAPQSPAKANAATSSPQGPQAMPLHLVEEQLAGMADAPAAAPPGRPSPVEPAVSLSAGGSLSQKSDTSAPGQRPEPEKMAPALLPASDGETGGRVLLGVVDRRNPSISHLLSGNPAYRKEVWEIIHAGVNQGKPYRRMPTGASVYLDAKTRELSWDGMETLPAGPDRVTEPARLAQPGVRGREEGERGQPEFSAAPSAAAGGEMPGAATPGASVPSGRVSLGSLSRGVPSVAHLLRNHPEYRDDTWRILKSPLNQGKPFNAMQLGTEVFLDPESDEIFWGAGASGIAESNALPDTSAALPPKAPAGNGGEGGTVSEETQQSFGDLAASVEPYFGRSYGEFDCYGLVVQGLKEMGINYSGPEGLKSNLIRLAVERGLPANAYLNGEGLIEVSGEKLYSKSLPRVQQPDQEAEAVFREMEPLLSRGCILSFSTPTRGHTGIVSQRDNSWTFINSGRMDHDIGDRNGRKRVGEEVLRAEIGNWFKLARERGESLLVTLGRLEEDKLRTASRGDVPGPERTVL